MNINKILVLTLFVVLLAACSKKSTSTGPIDTTTVPPKSDTVAVANWGFIQNDTSTFYPGTQVGKITSVVLKAIAGIGASRSYPGMFWVENDQGEANIAIYLVDTTGAERAAFAVAGGF